MVFSGEPEVIPEVVFDRAIRRAKLEGMLAPQQGHIVFELIALLVNDVRSAEVAPKPRQARYDQSRHGWLRRGGHRRVTRRELGPHLIDQIAPKIVRPGDNRRIVAIGQAGANGRRRAVTGADVVCKIPTQRETRVDGIPLCGLVIQPRAPGIEPRHTIEQALASLQEFEDRRIASRARRQSRTESG